MEIPYDFPADGYALAILTHAAMQTNQNSQTSNPSYESPILSSAALTAADARGGGGTGSTSITNHQTSRPEESHQPYLYSSRGGATSINNLSESMTPDILPGGYISAVPTSRNMETMSFNQHQVGLRRPDPYMPAGYHGVRAQTSTNYANNLGILNAESYDDGRHAMSAEAVSEMRVKQPVELPFGIEDHPIVRMDPEARTESDELEKGRKKVKKSKKHKMDESKNADEEEEARKKARGRPRVDTKDETATDRRRTQIRMAQRAYRHRKETTITSLEKQVQDLRGTNEEMSNIFISLYDFAVGKGLLQREPEFGQQLQSTTERFLALARSSVNEDVSVDEGHLEENTKLAEPQTARRTKNPRASPKKRQGELPQASEPDPEPAVQPWGGYYVAKEDSPIEEISSGFNQTSYESRARGGEHQIITRPTEENASFPFEFMDLQQYRVEVPSIDNFSQVFSPRSQLPLPNTSAHNESSFVRRIFRGALEKAWKLITLENPPPKRFQEVFGLTMMYENKESIKARLKAQIASSSKESLQEWRAPFVHMGGSGTFYPMRDSSTEELMPKFRTGYSMGPFSQQISGVQDLIQEDMRCKIPGYEGDFFDPNDVEGYLRGRGIYIPPAADFVTAELDLSELASSKSSAISESEMSALSPKTPEPLGNTALLDPSSFSYNYDFSRPECKAFPFPLGYADWEDNSTIKEASNLNPIFSTMQVTPFDRSKLTPGPALSERIFTEKRVVTVNVNVLLEELLGRSVCLHRSPGFRPNDVNLAIINAVKATF